MHHVATTWSGSWSWSWFRPAAWSWFRPAAWSWSIATSSWFFNWFWSSYRWSRFVSSSKRNYSPPWFLWKGFPGWWYFIIETFHKFPHRTWHIIIVSVSDVLDFKFTAQCVKQLTGWRGKCSSCQTAKHNHKCDSHCEILELFWAISDKMLFASLLLYNVSTSNNQ